jgi:hypothetical protein
MNVYDPADDIRYVHLSGSADARPAAADGTTTCSALPPGYANRSPRTRLQCHSRQVDAER